MYKELDKVERKLEEIRSQLNANTIKGNDIHLAYSLLLILQSALVDMPDELSFKYEHVLNDVLGC